MGLVRDVPQGLAPPVYEFLRELVHEIENTDARVQAAVEQAVSTGGGGVVTVPDGVEPDTRPVEAVANFSVLPSLRFIALAWDPPSGDNNVSYTEVWRSPDNNPSNMEFIANTSYPYYVDFVGPGSPVWFYRVRHVRLNRSAANQVSYVYGPFSVIESGATPPNLAEVLALLEGQLGELHLVQSLNDRIDLIDAPSVGLVDGLATEIGARISEISRVESEYQSADATLAQQIQNIVAAAGTQVFLQETAPLDDPPGTIDEGAVWYVTDAMGDRTGPVFQWVNDAWVDVTDPLIQQNIAAIQVNSTAIADLELDKAEASVVTTLQSTVGGHTALIQQNISSIDGVETEYAVRTDVNGYISGFGLINDGATSAFVVAADVFSVGQAGHADKPVFAIAPINGTPTIVLAADTLIADAAIENAMIGSLSAEKLFALSGTIADAVIGDGHITNLMIGNVIQSDNWNPTTREGWRITKDTGLIEAQGITIFNAAGAPIFGTGTGFNLNFTQINGTTRPEDNATVGATYGVNLANFPVFEDSFEDVSQWEQVGGAGSFQSVADSSAEFGGRALEATGAVILAAPERDIPFDPSAVYRVRIRVRDISSSTLQAYVGFAGVNFNRTQLVNISGANSYGSQHYVATSGGNPGSSYTEYEGFIAGYGAPNGAANGNSLANPWRAHSSVRYLRPLIYLNWSGGTSQRMRVDRFTLERVQEQITPDNISTYIAGLSVDTLFIADNAVTIPASGLTSLISHRDTNTTVVEATIDPAGQPVTLAFDAVLRRATGSALLFYMRVERVNSGGTTTIWGEFTLRLTQTVYYQLINIALPDFGPAAGNNTYRIIARSGGPNNLLEWRSATLQLTSTQK